MGNGMRVLVAVVVTVCAVAFALAAFVDDPEGDPIRNDQWRAPNTSAP